MRRHTAILVLATLALSAGAVAQSCNPGDLLLKNDALPDVPQGAFAVAIVPGLCNNEAAMSILPTNGPVTVRSVSAMFAQAQGTAGVTAAVDVEIYDGVTANANGTYALGPQVFRLSNGGSNAQIQTHGINTVPLPTPVRVISGTLVVGFRMVLNTATGSCLFGYTSNFATDATNTCVAGRNIIDAINHGPVDPATYQGFGQPLCPTFFRGDWIIRACVTPDAAVTVGGNATPGGIVTLTLSAPARAGDYYITLLSLGTMPGTVTPWGTIPLNSDFLLTCSIDPGCAGGILINGIGTLNGNGQAFPAVQIPPLPLLAGSGFTFYSGFVTSTSTTLTPFSSISAPSAPIVIN